MASEKRVTEADKIAYCAIKEFIKENGYPPSVRELCRITGKASTASIQYRLKSLEEKGYIKITHNGRRTIRITEKADVVEVVRCKDCKHYMTIHCTCDGCCISGDWYCADGERKDNGKA